MNRKKPTILRASLYAFTILPCFLFFTAIYGQNTKPGTGKEPGWVVLNSYDYADNRLYNEADDGYFDIVYERQISVENQAVYCHRALKILTTAGVQNASEVNVSFDPAYERLTFHTIRIVRNGTVIDQLNPSKIKTIQQEQELDLHLYNGTLSSVLFLEGVRKDDIVEYSYTISGFNPIFAGKFSCVFNTSFSSPTGNIYYRLVTPGSRSFFIKNIRSMVEPQIRELAGNTVYEWKLNNVKPVRTEDDVPLWHEPYSKIMVSEYKTWKEVNDWAMGLFPAVSTLSSDLQSKIQEIKTKYSDDEKRVLASLRFVQDDIRYMGIEIGENSHRPAHPNNTFSRRFGDCKDKSYLLCTMLRSLGIEACPVLINTSIKKAIADRLPSARAFDHVTVRAKVKNKYYWFDPTIAFQRGPIEQISFPDYQCGLVVSPETRDITMIDKKEPGSVSVEETFNIPDQSGKATLTVVTRYTGAFADDTRSSFQHNSSYEMQKDYNDFYANYIEEITADSISHEDNEKTGVFITREYYSIDSIWEMVGGIKTVTFSPYVIRGVIKRPVDKKRKMPFELSWPVKYKEEIIIHLPENWDASEVSNDINTASFVMSERFSFENQRTIHLTYVYENLKDHVEPGHIEEYLDGLDRIDEDFSYELTWGKNEIRFVSNKSEDGEENKSSSSTNLNIFLFVVVVIVGLTWLLTRR